MTNILEVKLFLDILFRDKTLEHEDRKSLEKFLILILKS